MKKKICAAVIILVGILALFYLVGTGFMKRTDVVCKK